MSVYSNEIDLEVLKYALEHYADSLPEEVSLRLLHTLQSLQNQEPDAAQHLCNLVSQTEAIDRIYTQALTVQRQHYTAQERAKSFTLTADNTSHLNRLSPFVNDLTQTLTQFQRQKTATQVSQAQQSILRALETHSLTLKDLTYRTGLPLPTLQTVVQSLRQRGYVDLLSAPLLYWIFPRLKPKRDRQQSIAEDEFLSLTSTGYFHLHSPKRGNE